MAYSTSASIYVFEVETVQVLTTASSGLVNPCHDRRLVLADAASESCCGTSALRTLESLVEMLLAAVTARAGRQDSP